MATRKDIRTSFYTALEDAVTDISFIGGEDISQSMPESSEELPRIVHSDDYREVPMNGASEGPHEVTKDNDGAIAELVFYSMMEAQFGVSIIHYKESEKETIYEAVRRYFEKFEHGFWDTTELHSDVHDINVADSTSDDDSDREPIARGDRIIVQLGFKRDYRVVREDLADTEGYEEYDATYADNIENVLSNVDADNDGTVDETNTTT